ncbi:MAG: SIS domain-containing protein [Verrucomicrobia bacterium]|nr:SIS domain-containing protein [Verrucomicrobiota bacterium]MBS0646601.1 SIS domain-containing protein [Verrucomicrobiota bacterium]
MQQKILDSVEEAIEVITGLRRHVATLEHCAQDITDCFLAGGKLLIAGNGGSLCDAMHFAEELTGFFRQKRPALPALALADPGHLSCVGNDVGFEHVFSRGVEAFGKKGDIFIALTTSGRSENLVRALKTAKKMGLKTLTFLGKGGGTLKGQADLELLIEADVHSDRIQEAHMTAIHILIEMVEHLMFGKAAAHLGAENVACVG